MVMLYKFSRAGAIFLECESKDVVGHQDSGSILPSDHYWTQGMQGWSLVGLKSDWEPVSPPSLPVVPKLPVRSAGGKVLDFNVAASSGIILGDDGVRYAFKASEWRSSSTLPVQGAQVNFEVRGADALSIFVISQPAPALRAPGTSPGDDKNLGYYRSSDEKFVGGVCAGLAHKWNRSALILRIVFFIFYPLLLVYIIMWLALPERSTKS